jgi:hypothetical protein
MKPFLSKGDNAESHPDAYSLNSSIPELRSGVERALAMLDEWTRENPFALSAEALMTLSRETKALRARFSSALERGDLVDISRLDILALPLSENLLRHVL